MTTGQIQDTLAGKIERAVSLLQMFVPKTHPYFGCFSGGKDSIVIKELVKRAQVPVVWHYHVTTIDPPELVHFIKREHPDVIWDRPPQNFFTRAVTCGFPTRLARWCCKEYKESVSPIGSVLILGIRAAESPRRAANWQTVTFNTQTHTHALAPILDWSDEEVWQFIRESQLPYCCLYDEGFKRLGCIGCPMAGRKGRLRQFARWPGFARKWRELFHNIWNKRTGTIQRGGKHWFGDRYF